MITEMEKEYDYLRQEIINSINLEHNMNNLLYVTVTAVLAWAFQSKNFLVCYLAYCIIIPMFLYATSTHKGMLNIAAYLCVFFDDFHWEKRLHRGNYNEHPHRKFSSAYRGPYIFSLAMCMALSFILYIQQKDVYIFNILLILLGTIVGIVFIVYILLQKHNDIIKHNYIKKWEDIKKEDMKNGIVLYEKINEDVHS